MDPCLTDTKSKCGVARYPHIVSYECSDVTVLLLLFYV